MAHQIGKEVSTNELANQLKVKSETVESYLDLLEKSFVIFRLKSYVTNERKEVTKMKKIYLLVLAGVLLLSACGTADAGHADGEGVEAHEAGEHRD